MQDLVDVADESLTPKKGAEARSQTVGSAGSRQEPPKAYSAVESTRGAVMRASQSGG